ncbi:hypothetical protein E4L96_03680 [Massilia arenosa]|uniref:Uncharacterized protein n=1 Tax=Zemynaea arenosa TaxID=2561931 RepID=A0A4Y9SRV8_9BURK|nr:hypothetical protein [Massilia arenosa]TFW27393.1 hypothetical protein E4L96_03680 [Massilia arenosa]
MPQPGRCFLPPRASAALATLVLALSAAPAAQAVPSTFAPVIGSALLCRSHLDNGYFQSWLTAAFGPPYKHEGGAWWYKAEASLWGANVTDVMVSDDSSNVTFIAAVTDSTPAQLEQSIHDAAGVRHVQADLSAFPVLESSPGSRIVYFKQRSKIYCAKFKQQP